MGQAAENTEQRDEVVLSWVAHPARRAPGRTVFAIVIVLGMVVLTRIGLQSNLLAVIALATLLVSTAPFFLPTRYTMTRRGMIQQRARVVRDRPWSSIRRVSAGPGAMLLSPYRVPSWLDRHRGLIVMFDGANRAEVLETARRLVADAAATATVAKPAQRPLQPEMVAHTQRSGG